MQFKVKPVENKLLMVECQWGIAVVTQLVITNTVLIETDDQDNIVIETNPEKFFLDKLLTELYRWVFEEIPE